MSSIIDYNKNVEDYLMQFGYLPKSNFAESMRSHQQIENAVKNLQFFAGLNITGHIDDFTLDLMAKYVHFCFLGQIGMESFIVCFMYLRFYEIIYLYFCK